MVGCRFRPPGSPDLRRNEATVVLVAEATGVEVAGATTVDGLEFDFQPDFLDAVLVSLGHLVNDVALGDEDFAVDVRCVRVGFGR